MYKDLFQKVSQRMAGLLRPNMARATHLGMDVDGYVSLAKLVDATWFNAEDILEVARTSVNSKGEYRYALRQYQGSDEHFIAANQKVSI